MRTIVLLLIALELVLVQYRAAQIAGELRFTNVLTAVRMGLIVPETDAPAPDKGSF